MARQSRGWRKLVFTNSRGDSAFSFLGLLWTCAAIGMGYAYQYYIMTIYFIVVLQVWIDWLIESSAYLDWILSHASHFQVVKVFQQFNLFARCADCCEGKPKQDSSYRDVPLSSKLDDSDWKMQWYFRRYIHVVKNMFCVWVLFLSMKRALLGICI